MKERERGREKVDGREKKRKNRNDIILVILFFSFLPPTLGVTPTR